MGKRVSTAIARIVWAATLFGGCHSAPDASPVPPATQASTPTTAVAYPPSASVADEPFAGVPIVVPAAASAEAPDPFVLALHGLGGTGPSFARHLRLGAAGARMGFAYAAPTGPRDSVGRPFWNAGPACCDFDGRAPDHVAELRSLLDRARADPRVDSRRLYVLGYSNGGFMAHRLGCDLEGLAGIASIAGAAPLDVGSCAHAPLAILQVHGDRDETVPFGGGHVLGDPSRPLHPGAADSVIGWARRAHCNGALEPKRSVDLGELRAATLTAPACAPSMMLLRVPNAGHDVASTPDAMSSVIQLLLLAGR